MTQDFRKLVREVHRRSMWQVLGVYVFGSWAGYQIVLSLTEGLGLPAWVPPIALILFIVGLPIVVATAMVQDHVATRHEGPSVEGLEHAGDAVAHAPAARPTPGRVGRLFTWNRAIVGGVLAFAALGLATTGVMAMRTLGFGPAATLFSNGTLDREDPIVLADFDGPADVAAVVTEALRVDLASSPVVELVPADRIAEAIRRMRRDPAEPLIREAARELAVREGHPAVIAGAVSRLAASYVLTAEVLAADDGAVLASFRETARDSSNLIDAIDELSASLRGKIGESLRSVRATAPLARYTTSSLEALERYADAERLTRTQANGLAAIAAYEDAVRLDPDFAMAWRKIGIEYSNMGVQPARRDSALTRAYRLADRLPDRESGLAVGSYHMTVTDSLEAAISALREVADRFDDPIAYNNLAVMLNRTGEWKGAERAARAALMVEPSPTYYNNLITALYGQGRLGEMRAVIREGRERFPDHPAVFSTWLSLPFAEGEYDTALARLDSILAHIDTDVGSAARGRLERGYILLARGRVDEAAAAYETVEDITRRVGFLREWLSLRVLRAEMAAWTLGQPDRAAEILDDALATLPLDSLAPADRPHLQLARVLAMIGDTAASAAQIRAWERTSVARVRPDEASDARGWLALAVDDTRGAIDHFSSAASARRCILCGLAELGLAYQRAGMADSARASLQRYVDANVLFRIENDAAYLGFAFESLAHLNEEAGDDDAAARYYGRLIELWEDADPPLQPRVDAARNRLAALVDERG